MTEQHEAPRDGLDRDERRRAIDAALESILTKDAELLARLADA
ncbi:hypothetical protein N2K95_03530 [Arthrobacter zhaoxinii]|uniref:Uncharacterized protein n=1 Tax=Arthrobacter zhaoxinii TaxID=2964616 RepID=A0ABY5YUL1_9MICC|nr:hypothetical protein [Arthrobacter zhaoxinii]UWX97768.1 hypothetical protein N2K95_03530 [Arthrobacter zhaoxinii]